MGVYPRHTFTNNADGTVTETHLEPGLRRTRVLVSAQGWQETRTNCYCCSCHTHGHDPYCRNHGFAGARPCEEHNMPGHADEESGVMPESVQAHRQKQRHVYD